MTGVVALRRGPVPAILVGAACLWVVVVLLARGMGGMTGSMGLGLVSFVGVWTLMMTAMMLPSVVPFVSLYERTLTVHRRTRLTGLLTGYLLVWALVGFPAYFIVSVANNLVVHHPWGTAVAVIVFAACGVYQVTPLKDRCLAHCRSPLGDLVHYSSYRGTTRDFRVGIHHGGSAWAAAGR